MVEQVHRTVELLLRYPPTDTQTYVYVALGLVIVYLLFERVSRVLDITGTQPAKSLFLVVLGGCVIVFSMALAQEYVFGQIHERFHNVCLFLTPVVASLAVTVPVICLLQKTNFVSASISWFISVLITGMLLIMLRVGVEAVTTGKVSLKGTIDRKEEVEQLLGD